MFHMEEYDKNMSEILDIQLALENYQDNTGRKISLLNETFLELEKLRQTKNNLSEEDLVKSSTEILMKFNKVLDMIGREKFIFYDDDGIGYKWDYSLLSRSQDE